MLATSTKEATEIGAFPCKKYLCERNKSGKRQALAKMKLEFFTKTFLDTIMTKQQPPLRLKTIL